VVRNRRGIQDHAKTVGLVAGEGCKILADHVDVRDLAAEQRVVSKAIQQFGRLDIVVANAGVLLGPAVGDLRPAMAGHHPHQHDGAKRPDRGYRPCGTAWSLPCDSMTSTQRVTLGSYQVELAFTT
jgi:Cu/Zn superoxide dismutase